MYLVSKNMYHILKGVKKMKRNGYRMLSIVLVFSIMFSVVTVNAVNNQISAVSGAISSHEYVKLELNVQNLITIEKEKQEVYLKFVPAESGTYKFYSKGDGDTFGTIYDSEFQEIQSDDDRGENFNFALICELTENQTYYLGSRFLGDADLGNFYVYAQEINIPELSAGMSIEETVDENVLYKFIPKEDNSFKLSISYDDYAYSSYGITLYDSNHNYIASGVDNKITHSFKAGEVYYFEISIMNQVDLKVSLEKVLGISQLEIVSLPHRMTYYKDGIKSLYDYNFEGLQLKATMTDGSVLHWQYHEGDLGEHNVSINAYYNEATDEDSDIVISCAGKTAEFSFVFIENPVESIELVSGRVPELVENVGGWWEGEYFYYSDLDTSNLQFGINYKNGTSEIVQIYDVIDGYTVSPNYYESQYDKPWTLGSNNYFAVEYLGKTISVPVTIIENPVERVELNSAPTREYIWGDVEFGYMWDDKTYDFYPSDMTGLSFTVYYTDGSCKNFTDDDINEYGMIDGQRYYLEHETYHAEVGNFPVVFRYMNHTVEYVVKMAESPVVGIEVIGNPNVTEYDERYAPDFIGMQVRVTYNDSSSMEVSITEDNITYEPDGAVGEPRYIIDVDGHLLDITWVYNENDEECYQLSYLGAICIYDGIEFYKGLEISTIESSNLTLTGENVSLCITYEDGLTEELWLEFVQFSRRDAELLVGFARTQKGILYCRIFEEEENGNLVNYEVYCLGDDWTIPVPPRNPEEYLSYEVIDSQVTITGCEDNITGHVVIPETIDGMPVTRIGEYAFYCCDNLESIIIPQNVISIEKYAFGECGSLTNVMMPEGVVNIGECAFYGCSNLENISLPNSVEQIGDYAFAFCKKLVTIIIPQKVNCIGQYTFGACENLASVIISEGMTSIGEIAFCGCINLVSIAIPEGVKSIGKRAFDGCRKLTSVKIPKSVEYIGESTFYDFFYSQERLITLYYMGSETDWEIVDKEDAFLNANIEIVYDSYIEKDSDNIKLNATKMEISTEVEFIATKVEEKDFLERVLANYVIEGYGINDCMLYDISLTKDNQKVQPEGEVTIAMPIPETVNAADCKVFYIDDSGNAIDMNAVYENGYMVFTTDHFSYYALVELLQTILGDFDETGLVDSDDAIHLLCNTLFGETDYPLNQDADVNGDGTVDSDDAVYLLCHTLFGAESYPLN